ncbi:endolytic transglycosylase MltG [Gordonia sp. NPDC003422]
MSEERRRSRHREHADQEGVDLERMRYFTQPAAGTSHTRHRRRRGSATTGPVPVVRPTERAMPQRIPPRPPTVEPPVPAEPSAPEPRRDREPSAVTDQLDTQAQPADTQTVETRPVDNRPTVVPVAETGRIATPETTSMRERSRPLVEPRTEDVVAADTEQVDATHARTVTGPRNGAVYADVTDTDLHDLDLHDTDLLDTEYFGHDTEYFGHDDVDADPHATHTFDAATPDAADLDAADLDVAEADTLLAGRPRRRGKRKRRRVVIALALACMLVLVIGVGYVGARSFGLLDSRKDYTNAAGTADVIVDIPDNSTLQDFGEILVDKNVVGSVRAFTKAADGQAISGGIYKLRTEIPAATAVDMLTDGTQNRVGRVVIPAGRQLDTKTRADGMVTPGIFQMIATATGVTVNGVQEGVTVEELEQTAATASPEALGVPSWAREPVNALTGDHRRIEGLIVPIAWERIDPSHSALQILHDMITQSARQFAQWGLPGQIQSGLSPYDTLIAASLVQGEVSQPDDYAKVARVIINRLDKGQRLQFDSTANYAAKVTDLNVHSDVLKGDTPWNTYVHKGLPPTPIGAVDEQALEAMERPAQGNWLYFVTIDSNGTTLFTADFNQHRRNIGRACANGFITCN